MDATPFTSKQTAMKDIELIMKDAVFEWIYPEGYVKGGQHAGMVRMGCKVSHPSFDVVIICHEARSQHRNREIATILFELAVKELLNL
jgi:protein subunit release factor A